MEQDVSAKVLRYTGSVFLAAAAVMVVWQIMGPSWFKNVHMEVNTRSDQHTISVTGEGKISAKPDIATISLSVVSKGLTVKQVTADNTSKMNQVIGVVKGLGIDAKDISTSQYNLYPEYDYSVVASGKIKGYNLTQEISLKIRDLSKVDDVLDVSTKTGVNQVSSLSFDIDDTSSVKKQARQVAFQKAKEKAQEMADQAGVRLGRIVTFSENSNSYPLPMMNYKMEALDSAMTQAPSPSIQAGEKELNLSVSVTYEIE